MRRTIALIAIVAGFVIGSKLLVENVFGFSFEPWARSWTAGAGTPARGRRRRPARPRHLHSGSLQHRHGPERRRVRRVWGSLLAFAGSIGGEWLGFELARRYGTAVSTRFIGDEPNAAA